MDKDSFARVETHDEGNEVVFNEDDGRGMHETTWDDVAKERFAGEVNNESEETLKERDFAVLRNIYPKNPNEEEEAYNEFLTKFQDLMPREEGESDDAYYERMMAFKNGDEQEKNDNSYTLTPFIKNSSEADALKKNDDLLMFLTSADGGFAIEKEKAADAFVDLVQNASDEKEFAVAKWLGSAIEHGEASFNEEDVQKVKACIETPVYQKKLFSSYIEQNKRLLEKKKEDLKRCLAAVEQAKEGGVLRNRQAIKNAEDMANWTRKGIMEAEGTIRYYSDKLKEMEESGVVSDAMMANANETPVLETEKAA